MTHVRSCWRVGLRSFAGFVFMSMCGCSSPAPSDGAGGDPDSERARLDANPFLGDGDHSPRQSIAAAYFAERGLSFSATAAAPWTPLDERAQLRLVLRNDGALPVTFVARRERGIWPFRTQESACVRLEASARYGSLRVGLQSLQQSLSFDEFDDLVLEPGSSRELLVRVDLALPADADAVIAEVEARLHSLAIRCGDEPERVVTVRFPAATLRYAPAAVAAALADDATPFARALDGIPEHLLGASLRLAQAQGATAVVDALMVSLPGPDARGRRARCLALEWLTGRRHGDSVERWRSWWESADGMSFSAAERRGS